MRPPDFYFEEPCRGVPAMSKMSKAEAATTSVQEHADKAVRMLTEGYDRQIMINFYGIFVDPHKRAAELHLARTEIDKAITAIDETPWPSNRDYEEAEQSAISNDEEK